MKDISKTNHSVSKEYNKQITRPSFFSEAAGVLFRACVVVGCALRLQPHAAGDAQRSSNSGQDGDQRLDNGFPNCFLVHFVN